MEKKERKEGWLKRLQDWHYKMCKKGAEVKGKDGKIHKLSDFARGVHKAKADSILAQRTSFRNKNNPSSQGK